MYELFEFILGILDILQINDYQQIFKNAMKHRKYSYDYNQTFTNESNISIK